MKKSDKVSFLPDIKVNIIFDGNQKNRSDSDDSDGEVNLIINNLIAYSWKTKHISNYRR